MPATRRYRAHSYGVNTHDLTTVTERDAGRGYGEAISEVLPVFRSFSLSSSIRYLIEDCLNVLYEDLV